MRGWTLALAAALLAFVVGVGGFLAIGERQRPFSGIEWARNVEARASMIDGAIAAVPVGSGKRDVGAVLGSPDEVVYDKQASAKGEAVPMTFRYRLGDGRWLDVEVGKDGKVQAAVVR